jgi:hypothetical protein
LWRGPAAAFDNRDHRVVRAELTGRRRNSRLAARRLAARDSTLVVPASVPEMEMEIRRSIPLVAVLLTAAAAFAAAQPKPSEHGTVSQTVDGTVITIEYDRPVARGRDSLFGKVVKLDSLWTPGANWATTIEASKDIQLEGHAVPAGKYSIWMIPRREGDWTVVLSRATRRFHSQRPEPADDLVRFEIGPAQAPHAEVLTWSFPLVTPTGTTLLFQWGTTAVPLRITVTPSG